MVRIVISNKKDYDYNLNHNIHHLLYSLDVQTWFDILGPTDCHRVKINKLSKFMNHYHENYNVICLQKKINKHNYENYIIDSNLE